MSKCIVEIKVLNSLMEQKWGTPKYATEGSSGVDLRACLDSNLVLQPGATAIVPSGIAVNIQNKTIMAMLVPRSGIGSEGLILANSTGIIDSDYQGEIKIVVWNRTQNKTFEIEPGQRICQMIFLPIIQVSFKSVEDFSNNSVRNDGGFGHSGRI